MAAARGRGDEDDDDETWRRGQSSMMDAYHPQGHPHQQQQQYMRQYDPSREQSHSSRQQQQRQRREYDNNARQQHLHYQQQQQQQSTQYDNTYPDNYSKEQIDMQEVSRYPPSQQQQYLNPALALPPHGYSGSSGAAPTPARNLRTAVQGGNNGPAYAPAPVATASMADLRDSMTNSTISDGGAGGGANTAIVSGKKPKRVYETAFGPFSWSDLIKRKYWKYYAMLIIIGVVVLLAVIFHDDIIKWMQPIAEKIRDIPGGWAIWVGIMFVISFPPLFGHEVVCLLCGLIYGLWWGFAIISLGTMLGEWGNFFVFKYWCSARSAKTEEKDVTYACICRVVREGGFRIAFMARLSALPGHLTTPAFAACGMSFWIFSITAILTLPKQLMAVYLGTVFGQDNEGEKITTSKIVEWVVLGISFLITIWAAWYIYAKMAKWRPIVMEEQAANRLAAQEVLERDSTLAPATVATTAYDDPRKSEIPRVTLSDEAGMIKSPSGRSNRLSAHRWPFHGQGHNRGSDDGSGNGSGSARRMEEGSLGDLEGASSPLVADSAAPAGYSSSRQHYQNSLYPNSAGVSPYTSSEEDIGYGYADGGEAYTVPYSANGRVDPSSSENVSMKWKPSRPEEDVPVQQQQNNGQRQRSPAPPAQYNPAQYQQAYQTRSQPHSESYQQRESPSHQTSTLPASLPQPSRDGQSFSTPYRQPDVAVQDARSMPSHFPMPESIPRSLQASLPQQVSPADAYQKSASQLPQGADAYPEQQICVQQQPQESFQQTQHQEPASSYPDMINSRGGYPVSQTQYHSGPPAQASTRYRSEADPSRPSPYHSGPIDPDAAYRAAGQSREGHQRQERSRYPPDGAPRY